MAAVDLGLLSVAEALDIEFIPWRVRALAEKARSAAPGIDLRMDVGLGASRMIDSDSPAGIEGPILYWGDFHHMAQYVSAVAPSSAIRLGTIEPDDIFFWMASMWILSLGQRPSVTLIFNSAAHFMDNNTGPPFADISATIMSHGFGTPFRQPSPLAFDPGLAYRQAWIQPCLSGRASSTTGSHHRTFGVFLGRTSRGLQGLIQIAENLSLKMGWQLEWIDWGDSGGFLE